MVQIEIDGKPVEVKEGTTVIQAAHQLGTYIPHFCYHKKLTIAANCRMCLVEVEKAPKPLPACATPVNAGMKIFTKSAKTVAAQKSVMEFLLINHPLDCPICDQGGECQLQDLTVGYGKSNSRYQEEKRVVFHKNIGPLISMEEMSRCIHCTRCVRFGQEIAGVMELGMLNRGEHSEITAFVGQTVDSELSGNMIDICPVGALTSKPFRYAARTWELGRKKSISPHDSLGSNTIVQTKAEQVKRVVPFENEAINECWISDKDRFAYEGLNSSERVLHPMVKQNGQWLECDWQTALDYVVDGLKGVKQDHGAGSIASLAHPISTVEELFLLQKLALGLGSSQVQTRLRQSDFRGKSQVSWLGLAVEAIDRLDRALVIGSFLRKDHPILAARFRKASKTGLRLMRIDSGGDDWLIPTASAQALAPSLWLQALEHIAVAIAQQKGITAPAGATQTDPIAQALAKSMISGKSSAIFLGNTVLAHPDFSQIHAWSAWIAKETSSSLGFLGEGANFVGAQVLSANGNSDPVDAKVSSATDRQARAVILLNVEPTADLVNPMQAQLALRQAETVIALSPYMTSDLLDLADVILPITPYTEQAGTYINIAGDVQFSQATVRPMGQARPAWKVLRVLGDSLGIDGFNFNTVEEVKNSALDGLDIKALFNNEASCEILPVGSHALSSVGLGQGLERLADVPIYFTDAIVRRAPSLQLTVDSKRAMKVGLPVGLFKQMDLQEGDSVRVLQDGLQVVMPATMQQGLAEGVVRVSAGTAASALLGSMFGRLEVQRA